MTTGIASSHMCYALLEDVLFDEVGGSGDRDEAFGIAIDQQHTGTDRQRLGLRRWRVPTRCASCRRRP